MFVLIYYSPNEDKTKMRIVKHSFHKIGDINSYGWVIIQRFELINGILFSTPYGRYNYPFPISFKEKCKTKMIEFIKSI